MTMVSQMLCKKKILVLGSLFRQADEFCLLKKSKIGLQNQANTFQWALIKGFDSILNKPVDIINVLPVGTYPKQYEDLILKGKKWEHQLGAHNEEIWSINIPLFKQITRTMLCRKAINRWIENNEHEELFIIALVCYLPFLMAVQDVPQNVKVILIVPDIPEYMDLRLSIPLPIKIFRSLHDKIFYWSINRIDGFVLLTEQMKFPLHIGTRPYVVMEGLVDHDLVKSSDNTIRDINKKVILYTGSLNIQFGIMDLLDAIDLIANYNYEFWICGSGEAEKEIEKRCAHDKRIKYFGYVAKNEILKLQQKATVLINPRNNEGEYTKYSFPSKTMEYLMSGKPVIMYKLDGIPDEYDPFLYYITGNSPRDIANKIIEVAGKSQAELDVCGNRARQFVMKNKNHIVQARKILSPCSS